MSRGVADADRLDVDGACGLIVELLRELRERDGHAERVRELLRVAIDLLRERERELTARERTIENLRDELRRYVRRHVMESAA